MTPAEWAAVALLTGAALGWWGARTGRRTHVAVAPETPVAPVPAVPAGENVFAALMRALPIGVIAVDRGYHIEFANAAAGTTFGFDATRVIGFHIIKAVPNIEVERRIADALRGEASVAPLMLRGAAPGERTFRISIFPLVDEATQQRRVMIFSDDQTALLRLERAGKSSCRTFRTNYARRCRPSNSCWKR